MPFGYSIGDPELDPLSFVRRLLLPRGRRATYRLRQTVHDNASSGVLVPNNPLREALILSYTAANSQRISLSPDAPSTAGILLNTTTTPLFLTREAFGELITAEWYFSGFDGALTANALTVIERIRQ